METVFLKITEYHVIVKRNQYTSNRFGLVHLALYQIENAMLVLMIIIYKYYPMDCHVVAMVYARWTKKMIVGSVIVNPIILETGVQFQLMKQICV